MEARAADRSFFELAPDTVDTLKRRSLDAALEGLVASVLRHAGGRLDDDHALSSPKSAPSARLGDDRLPPPIHEVAATGG